MDRLYYLGGMLLLVGIALLISTFPFMWAWNYIAPLFKLPIISFWQAFCILLVGRAFFWQPTRRNEEG